MSKPRRQELAEAVGSLDLLSGVRALAPAEFERWVADLLRLHFPSADVQVVGASGDRGVDVVVIDAKGTLVVQCKRYGQEKLVGSRDMQMFLGAMMHRQTSRGAFITTSRFTSEARAIGTAHRIWLVDEERLADLAARYDPVIQEKTRALKEAEEAEEEDRHQREYHAWLRNQEKWRQKQEAAAADYLRWQAQKRAAEEARLQEFRRRETLELFGPLFTMFFCLWAVILIAASLYVEANVETFGRHPNDLPALLCVTAVLAATVLQLIITIGRRFLR